MNVTRQCRDRQTEVANLDRAVAVHEAVRRLDVAVQNAGGLRGVEPADDVEYRGHRHCRRQGTLGGDAILQRAAGQQLHRDDRDAGDLLAAEDVDGVRMADRGGELPLAQKPRAFVGVLQAAAQHLERNPSTALGVLGFVDLAHPAAAEQTADAIRSPGLTGGELEHVRRVRGRAEARRHRQRLVQRGVRQRLGRRGEETGRAEAFGRAIGQGLAASGAQPWQESNVLHTGIRQNRLNEVTYPAPAPDTGSRRRRPPDRTRFQRCPCAARPETCAAGGERRFSGPLQWCRAGWP